ncbi:MAG: mechanosensitive ion channel [bacterium]|nr:mechanosensitive ion channel [bacterium]
MEALPDLVSEHALNLGLSLLSLILIFTARHLILRAVIARVQDTQAAFRARKLSFYVSAGLFLLVIGIIWTSQLAGAGSFLGILSAGIAIALTDVLKNVAGWLLIVFRRPFKVGDRIEIGSDAGDVIDIGVFRFSLQEIRNWVDADQTTGRILHIPNGLVFVEPLANFTEAFPYIWHEIPMTVTFESDWEQAREMVQNVVDRYALDAEQAAAVGELEKSATQYSGLYRDLAPSVFVEAIDFGVTVTGRLLVEARERRLMTSLIWQDLLSELSQAPNVTLAYPTTRFFRADLE